MNKLLFDASGNVQGPISVAGHYQYEQDYEGKKSVLSFIKKGDSLKIPESQINFDGESDYLEFNFRMDTPPEAGTETDIVSGKAIPFTLSCFAGEKGLMLHTQLTTDSDGRKYLRESESATPLKYATWYNVKIVFIHDEYFLLIDDKPHLRRIYKGVWWEYAKQNLVFGGGEQTGLHVCDIAFSEDIFEESSSDSINAVFQQMNDDDFMEVDSCIRDCALDGIVLQGKASQVTIAGKACSVYPNGAIVFDCDDKALYLSPAIYKYYANHLQQTGCPIAYTEYTCDADNNRIEFGLFSNLGVFHNATKNTTTVIEGDILSRFLNCDLKAYENWYPTSASSYTSASVKIDYAVFSTGLVIYAFDAQTFLFPVGFHDYLRQSGTIDRTGLPVDDYRIGVNTFGKAVYQALDCQNGTIHSTDTFKNFFCDKDLGQPEKLDGTREVPGGTIHYYDFESGVIVLYPGQSEPVAHTGIQLRFDKVTTGKIDDGINSTAELYMKLTLIGQGLLENDLQLGNKAYYGGSSNYVWGTDHNNYTLTPLRGNSSFHIVLKLYDYDPESGDEYLGTFDYTFSIANGWGIDPYDGEQTFGIHNLPMTSEGNDNCNGLGNNRLYLSLCDTYNMDEMLQDIRKNFTLPFSNFNGSYSFDYERFTTIFTNTNKLTLGYLNYLLHPIDAIFYGVCNSALSGAKCFGFAASELLALHEAGPFTPSLSKYTATAKVYVDNYDEVDPRVADRICDYYLYQFGWDYIMWKWRKMNANEYIIAHSSIPSIIDRLDKEKYCMINMAPSNLKGHAVLAYGYRKIKPEDRLPNGNYQLADIEIKADHDYLIYVADCNDPYYAGETPGAYSVIAFEKESIVKDWVKVYYVNGNTATDKKYGFCYIMETPYSIASKPPRVPNAFDVVIDSITNMIGGWFDASTDDVQISDPATNEVLYDKKQGIMKSDKIMVFKSMDANGADSPTGFFLKGNDVSVKLRGAKKENIKLHVAGRETDAEFKAGLAQGEEFKLSLRNIHRPERFSTDIRSNQASKTVESEISFVDRRNKSTRNVFTKKFTVEKGQAKLSTFNVGSRMKIGGSTVKAQQQRITVPASRAQEIALKRRYPGALILNRQLTTTQVSKLYRVATSTARSYCRQGLIPGASKVNNRWSVPSENNATK